MSEFMVANTGRDGREERARATWPERERESRLDGPCEPLYWPQKTSIRPMSMSYICMTEAD